MIQADYGVTVRPITSRQPQAYSILESFHQTIGSIIRPFNVKEMVLNDKKSCDVNFASTIFALRATVHPTTRYTPAQLVFGLNSILNTCNKVNWHLIKKRKQDLVIKGRQLQLQRAYVQQRGQSPT